MNKIIVAFVAAPQLALASGVIVGALAWLITLPFNSIILIIVLATIVMIGGVIRPWLGYRRHVINHQPRFHHGSSQAEYNKYVQDKEHFNVRMRKIARAIGAWTAGLCIGFFPLVFLSLLT